MGTEVKKYVGAGFAWAGWYVRDVYGYMQGAPDAPVKGADGAAIARLLGAKSAPFAPVQPDRPTATGDDGAIARFLFQPVELPEATIAVAVGDLDFNAAAVNTLVDVIGGGAFAPLQPDQPSFADLGILLVAQAKSQETGTVGAGLYECRLILAANAYPRGRASFEERATSQYEFDLIGNYADCYPWGTAFSADTLGTERAVAIDFTWPYKPCIERWTGTGAVATFNLSYPHNEASAENTAVFVNGVAQTWDGDTPGAGEYKTVAGETQTLVLGTAPADDAKIVAIYGWA